MRIGLYHGYELTGSGSNEYTRYLARFLVHNGHEVHIICREKHPEKIPFITEAFSWDAEGNAKRIFRHDASCGVCILHRLPDGPVIPVFLTDKQRSGNVKSFVSLSDEELCEYHQLNENVLASILTKHPLDVLQANHLVYQPVAACKPCAMTHTPLVIYPHGRCDRIYRSNRMSGTAGLPAMRFWHVQGSLSETGKSATVLFNCIPNMKNH